MAVFSIGYQYFLLPMSKATKVMELLSTSAEVDETYIDREHVFIVKEQPNMSMKLIHQRQVRMPEGTVEETKPKPRRLTRT